jgi:hypothetical protein
MARIRTVKPDLFGSYTMAKVPIEARYLFVALFSEADDDGRLIDSPKRLAGAVFPHDEKVTEKRVNGWLDALQKIGSVLRYEERGGKYLLLPNWASHQRISHPSPSKLPPPSGEVLEAFQKAQEALRPDLGTGKGI